MKPISYKCFSSNTCRRRTWSLLSVLLKGGTIDMHFLATRP